MYVLHIANKNYSSWSLRPWLLLSELGIPFEERLTPFGSAPFGGFSPTAKVPCLHDDETIVWESLAIAEYLAERHADVWPAAAQTRAWARCAAAEMHAGFGALRNACPMNCGIRVRLHELSAALRADLARLDALWCEGLSRFGGPYLAGAAFSAVDAFFAPVAFRVQIYDLPLSVAASEYALRLLALPAMRRWQADALVEPWRDAEHDEEVAGLGICLEDRRVVQRDSA